MRDASRGVRGVESDPFTGDLGGHGAGPVYEAESATEFNIFGRGRAFQGGK